MYDFKRCMLAPGESCLLQACMSSRPVLLDVIGSGYLFVGTGRYLTARLTSGHSCTTRYHLTVQNG